MNRSTKYVKNQELKRFNNIKGKKKYLLTSKVMNRMELSVPIILYLMFIGIVVYLMRYQGNEKIATVCGGVAMNLGFYQEYDKRKHKDLSKYKMDFLKSIIVNDKLYNYCVR